VCITTPSALHLVPALAAIRAGKHLMIEKPLDARSKARTTSCTSREGRRARGLHLPGAFRRCGAALKAAVDAGASAAWCSRAAT
jgi:hypothetical protein